MKLKHRAFTFPRSDDLGGNQFGLLPTLGDRLYVPLRQPATLFLTKNGDRRTSFFFLSLGCQLAQGTYQLLRVGIILQY